MKNNIYLPDIVGKGYKDFWETKKRYRVCKGSRASKKSKTTALNMIVRLMQYPLANALVVRKTYRTLRDSCYADLKWAIHRLGVDGWWDCTTNPLEITYKPTGQKILFRGMDDSMKITSISVEKGVLCFVWLEESYEISNESDFDMLDESIRGEMPEGYFKQITLTLNPWNSKHWIKRRFFDTPSDNVFIKTTNYLCNEFLDEADKIVFEEMKIHNPDRYRVAGLGEWGVVEGAIYTKFIDNKSKFIIDEVKETLPIISIGIDYGASVGRTVFQASGIGLQYKNVYMLKQKVLNETFDPDAVYQAFGEFFNDVIKKYGKAQYVFCDWGGLGQIITRGLWRYAQQNKFPTKIQDCVKGTILDRIEMVQTLMAEERYFIVKGENELLETALEEAIWNPDKIDTRLDDGTSDIDSLDAMEYSIFPFYSKIIDSRDTINNRKLVINSL